MHFMSNNERDTFRDITPDDQALYNKFYKGVKPGNLKYISEDRTNFQQPYSGWESLISHVSPWREFLDEPEELFKYLVGNRLQLSENKHLWLEIREQSLHDLRLKLQKAGEVSIKAALHLKILDPAVHYVHLSNEYGENKLECFDMKLGKLVMISQASSDEILDFANSNPWGRNGGFQKLANMIKKPVTAVGGEIYGGEPLALTYLPGL